jgi:hypothetical protein
VEKYRSTIDGEMGAKAAAVAHAVEAAAAINRRRTGIIVDQRTRWAGLLRRGGEPEV